MQVHDVKEETEDYAICKPPAGHEGGSPVAVETGKRSSAEIVPDTNQSTSSKRPRVSGEMRRRFPDDGGRHEPLCLSTAGEKSRSSYRKPLFSISHRISDRRNPPILEPQNQTQTQTQTQNHLHHGGLNLNQLDLCGLLSSKLQNPEQNGVSEPPPPPALTPPPPPQTSLYPPIEKMFFILNTLNSSMTQLHSKVDLLTLEVMRIKKQIKPPAEKVTEFQPPPEYLLTSEELNQLMEQTSGPGELGCRLLVHLFPELFKARECGHDCVASKRTLESLHLQLIRNYVEVCYPSVKANGVWQEECLLQSYRFINEQGEEETVSVDEPDPSEPELSTPTEEELDEFSSPEDFVIFLMHRLFPEVFEERRTPERPGCLGNVGQLILDSDKMDVSHFQPELDAEAPSLPPEKSSKDFCKIPLEELIVPRPDFPVPPGHLLSDGEVREVVQQSLSVGNFAARLLVRLFPELFTQDNLRLQYNHSGACNKKQLDPVRLRLIRHYVEAVYPVDKMEEVWHYECVPSIDERCRRPNRKKCDILKKAKRSSTVS
ncbi:unnamed protein product [Menidia menidia]|uniref:(Atlantic silverside) hypothetical protein n=1 Tax=Menidia menidia TaxID=238744 RepID=A0A8S4ABX7_9TELE|nr:unnamed protein product [Menidia menidia]